MYISARERIILDILLSAEDDTTIKQLADALDVSERTIHRDLKGSETVLEQFNITLVKKAGVGIRLVGDPEDINALKLMLYKQSHNEYTPEERQTILLCSLLEAVEPMKLVSLANDLHVTIVTISHDLTRLEEQLQDYGLQVVRKRGYGVELVGEERAKRRVMSDMLARHMDEVEFLSLIRKNIQHKPTAQTDSISEKLLGLVEREKLVIVERVIEEINNELDYFIADSAYIALVVHLGLAIERILQGENIKIDKSYLESLKITPEYKIANRIIAKLEKVFQIDIPEAEIGYITMHLQGAKLRYEYEYMVESTHLQTAAKAKQLIDYVEARLNTPLGDDYSLFQGLITHLTPALYRVQQDMRIHNPLLEKIKEDYQMLFDIIRNGAEEVFPDLTIPDEEIGFLVLHFGSALLSHQRQEQLQALVICSSGIGTSKILSTRIKQEIPEISHLRNVSLFELQQIDTSAYDIIISTIRLPEFDEEGYILVSPILTKEETERIKAFIHGKAKGVQLAEVVTDSGPKIYYSNVKGFVTSLEASQHYAEAIVSVLKSFTLETFEKETTTKAVLTRACSQLLEAGMITDEEQVVRALLERERLGGLGIPNTRLALFHARSHQIGQPVFRSLYTQKPLDLKGMDGKDVEVDHLLLLLAPEETSKQTLEVLSLISAIIIESKESIALFESDNQQLMLSFLSMQLEKFYHEKIQEMRNS
ncbi:transcriptional regulator MtlR [Pullulanibacillus camelliae]|uniref:Transcriptional regulator MtlR n=1 Tax=Pullulanibacillus camelliae TaxID=1707096 RepID=A0A8J2VFK8_9BACL|nr:PRD domain-containing protein [Pullulanibacillus camelliae]GGE29665.1 transcriptional regulator MtlR [Pullulanibacillus camelliae]